MQCWTGCNEETGLYIVPLSENECSLHGVGVERSGGNGIFQVEAEALLI